MAHSKTPPESIYVNESKEWISIYGSWRWLCYVSGSTSERGYAYSVAKSITERCTLVHRS